MKSTIAAAILLALSGAAYADGVSDAKIEPAVIQDATVSSNDNWVGLVMTLIVFGVAATK